MDLVIDEVLRIDDPFVSNRRVTTAPVDLGGVRLPEGARVKLHWTSANRDEVVVADPEAFDPVGHAADNLVYGVGRHACPGRLLATAELRIAVRALLAGTTTSRSIPTGRRSGKFPRSAAGRGCQAPQLVLLELNRMLPMSTRARALRSPRSSLHPWRFRLSSACSPTTPTA